MTPDKHYSTSELLNATATVVGMVDLEVKVMKTHLDNETFTCLLLVRRYASDLANALFDYDRLLGERKR